MLDWLFAKRPDKAKLHDHKTVYIRGSKFVIRPIVPLLDFDAANMPQIFTETTRTKLDISSQLIQKKINADVAAVIFAGVVDPPLVGAGKESEGITANDILRDQEVGGLLYLAIIEHSLFRFKGLKKAFFLLAKQLIRFTCWLKHMGKGPQISSSMDKVPA